MNSFLRVYNFINESIFEIRRQIKIYFPLFLSLVFLDNLESVLTILGLNEESPLFLALNFLTAIFSFVVLSKVVLIQKQKHQLSAKENLFFFIPTFLLYNLYYSFFFLFGTVLFIFPGIYVLFFFYLSPFVAVLESGGGRSIFQRSIELTKKDFGVVAWCSFISLLFELSSLGLGMISNPLSRMIINLLLSLPFAFLAIALTVTSTNIYYYLVKKS